MWAHRPDTTFRLDAVLAAIILGATYTLIHWATACFSNKKSSNIAFEDFFSNLVYAAANQ